MHGGVEALNEWLGKRASFMGQESLLLSILTLFVSFVICLIMVSKQIVLVTVAGVLVAERLINRKIGWKKLVRECLSKFGIKMTTSKVLKPHATIPKPEGPVLVCILDGYGENEYKDEYNAVHTAETPCFDKLRANADRFRCGFWNCCCSDPCLVVGLLRSRFLPGLMSDKVIPRRYIFLKYVRVH
jgi:hypothetical protein